MSPEYPEDSLSALELETLKLAKGGVWYDGWKPYCLKCNSLNRMNRRRYGFKCLNCFNEIGWDLKPL